MPQCALNSCRREDTFADQTFDQKCIFHTDKNSWFEIRADGTKDWTRYMTNVNLFWEELKKEKIEKNDFSFSLFIFPLFPSNNPFSHANTERIKGEVRFTGAKFLSWVTFSSIWFENSVFFDGVVFSERVEFSHVEFLKYATFSNARFLGGVTITAIFHGETQFRNIFFSPDHPGRFQPYFPSEEYSMFKEATYFTGVNFPRSITFQNINLSNVSFSGSNLEEFRLLECSFKRVHGRYELFDERRVFEKSGGLIPKTYFGIVEDMYRQLKFNFETRNDWQNATEFFVSQMEIKRLRLKIEANDLKIRKEIWSGTNNFPLPQTTFLQKISNRLPRIDTHIWWRNSLDRFFLVGFDLISRYGEQPDRALLWISSVLLLGTCGIFLAQCFSWNDSLLTTVRAVTFQQENGFDFLNHSTQWIITLLRIASAILLPLFLLALRRRFKR